MHCTESPHNKHSARHPMVVVYYFCSRCTLRVYMSGRGSVGLPSGRNGADFLSPQGFRVFAYHSPGLPHGSHARLRLVPYTAAIMMEGSS